ncbi:dual specificity protein phosphatase 8 [Trichomycterus rosablanca]|uniref:dual specificity protein phosphatase 8 n=1 Tax=Trichomycterus rosablanca TaxID=2290929 RepID=UPI002F35C187
MMVYQSERAPLSRILPQLYLGAESDITQDCLSARGISYVLSVSRCCPQPSFLPQSQYLRIPIDDSLKDDLLPWIPQALRFIDGAMSLGCSVIVHCAAGISRSPALAVAYIMYSLEMDLDHAYRFVKERRPTISPNFNFLGQLQLFQGTLPLNSNSTPVTKQPTCVNTNSSTGLSTSTEKQNPTTDNNNKGGSTHENKNLHSDTYKTKPEFTLSLSDKLRNLSLNIEPIKLQEPSSAAPLSPQNLQTPTPQKPTHLQLPSLLVKRKSLTLSLTPQTSPQTSPADAPHQKSTTHTNNNLNLNASGSPADQKVERKITGNHTSHFVSPAEPNTSREASTRCSKSRSQKRRSDSQNGCSSASHRGKEEQTKPKRERRKKRSSAQSTCVSTPDRRAAPGTELTGGAVEADEASAGDQSPLSPINVTVNRLLGWGERMLLGVLLGPHIKVGQASLPYRC